MKNIFKKKQNVITLGIVLGVLIVFLIIVIFIVNRQEKKKYELDKFYSVYPEDIKVVYSYLTDISCTGAMHFDVKLDGEEYLVSDWNNTELLNYTFSYIDKYAILMDKIKVEHIEEAIDLLFVDKPFDLDDIKNYSYDDYVYTYKDDTLERKEKKCSSEIRYVSDLYGYSYTTNMLSVDVNMGYEKDGILYDLSGNKLGKYSDKASDRRNLFVNNSYYKFNYVNDNGTYKIYSVEWKNKI